MTRVAVTGGGGFIGSQLVDRLLEDGHEVTCLVRRESDLTWLGDPRVNLALVDFGSPESVGPALAPCEAVFHLAGVTKASKQRDFWEGNQGLTRNLLQAMDSHGPDRQFICYLSSLTAAGPDSARPFPEEAAPANPVSQYGASKLAAEELLLAQAGRRPVAIIRPSVVYGPRDRAMLPLFKLVRRGIAPLPGRRDALVSMLAVQDLVEALILAWSRHPGGARIYHVSDGQPREQEEVLRAVARALNRKATVLPVPLCLVRAASRLGELANRFRGDLIWLNHDKWLDIKQEGWVCSPARARQGLGFVPQIALGQGMARTAAWYQEAGWL
jgi:dihydroflavonol-4-reductase